MPILQAGAVVVRTDGTAPQFLLVKAKRDPLLWIFPKGHIEPGETAQQTALREAGEEAGITGIVRAPVGALEFESDGRRLHVEYFLVEWTGEAAESEQRPFAWGTYAETRDRLKFANARELLATANAIIESRSGTRG